MHSANQHDLMDKPQPYVVLMDAACLAHSGHTYTYIYIGLAQRRNITPRHVMLF